MRALILGAGRMGAHHARVVAADPAVSEVLVADVHPERAEALAGQMGGRAVSREAAVPTGLQVRWVVVATPTVHHAEALQWAVAGADVLVEKPLAADVTTARQLIHPRIHVGHIERHNPAWAACTPAGLTRLRSRRIVVRPPSEEPGRDVVSDLLIHDLDLLRLHVAGPLELVDVRGDPARRVAVGIRAPGLEATLEAGVGTPEEASRCWEGQDVLGRFALDLVAGRAWRNGEACEGRGGDALVAQWRAFRGGHGVGAAEGLEALELAMAVLGRLAERRDGAAGPREIHDA